MNRKIRIGTRGSELALWQANETARKLREAGYSPELHVHKTTGDKRQDVPLASIGGKGLFVKELEEALERGEIDIAVHSLKDVPSIIPPRFALVAYLERADPRDAWIHPGGKPIDDIPYGSIIGTSSPRRRAQLMERYPSLQIEPVRGNVESRIRKAREGLYAGIILASAGLSRLGLTSAVTSYFTVDEMVPAAGQGIVGIEVVANDRYAIDAARAINHAPSEVAALCERGVLQRFGEQLDCYSAVATHATKENGALTIRAFLADYDGTRSIRVTHSGTNPQNVIAAVYDDLVAKGAMELVCAQQK